MAVKLQRRRFTVDEYYAMADAGILHEDDRVELIEGEIVQMAAIGSRHAACVNRLTRLLVERARDAAVVTVQNPVRLSVVEVHAEPGEGRYAAREVMGRGRVLRPRRLPSAEVSVEGLLG